MDKEKIRVLSTAMLSFITFLGVLFALLYYFYQFKNIGLLNAVLISEIYISINLLVLYIIKRGIA